MITVETVLAFPTRQQSLTIQLPGGSCVRDALLQSRLLEYFSDIRIDDVSFGIFGKKVTLDTLLHDGDRVECYRPLMISPKQARLLRNRRNKQRENKVSA